MRYLLSIAAGLLLLAACNNRATVNPDDLREPVYYDESDINVPEPQADVPAPTVQRGKRNIKVVQPVTEVVEPQLTSAEPPARIGERNTAPARVTPPAIVDPQGLQGLQQPDPAAARAKAERVEQDRRPVTPAPQPKPGTGNIDLTKASDNVKATTPPATGEALIAYPTHELLNTLLRQYVDERGRVDYAGLKSRVTALDKYLQRLESDAPDSSWPAKEAMAYWINAYNAYTLKLIVDNYPLNSIKDLHGGNPWDVKWINIGGQSYSLNNIEHDILRKDFFDPRIHAVVNCAAASCPPLWNRAFTADNLDKGLQTRTTAWINNPAYNRVSERSLELSKLFDWYGQDFGDKIDFVNEYFRGDEISEQANISYLDYDWALNAQ